MLARSGRRVVLIEPNISRLSFFSSFFCEEKQGTKKKRELFPKLWKLETEGKISGTLFSFEYLDFFVVVGNSEKKKKKKKRVKRPQTGLFQVSTNGATQYMMVYRNYSRDT